jgi:hypothetical protein
VVFELSSIRLDRSSSAAWRFSVGRRRSRPGLVQRLAGFLDHVDAHDTCQPRPLRAGWRLALRSGKHASATAGEAWAASLSRVRSASLLAARPLARAAASIWVPRPLRGEGLGVGLAAHDDLGQRAGLAGAYVAALSL